MLIRLTGLLLPLLCLLTCDSGRADIHDSAPLQLRWTHLANDSLGREHRALLEIINRSADTVRSGWELHFNSSLPIDTVLLPGVRVKHSGGDYFIIAAESAGRPIPPGDTLRISYVGSRSLQRTSDAPAGPFLVNGEKVQNVPIAYTPDARLDQFRAAAIDQKPLPTAADRYAANAMLTPVRLDETSQIIPTPQRFVSSGTFAELPAGSTVSAPEEWGNELALLQSYWRTWTGQELRVVTENPTIRLAVDPNLISRPEAYALEVREENRMLILAGGGAGVFYALQSLRALVPTAAYRAPVTALRLPVVIVNDAPRFPYRGLMLDVSRNFHSKASVLKLLDLMAFYKLNRLHLHLTDDEGWRLEIAGLPELTEVGARRGYAAGEKDRLHPSYGSGAETTAPGSGYYSRADFIEILRYAADRHIQVIPEFDFPGHARAAILAMEARYDRLQSAGRTEAASAFRLLSEADTSHYRSIQGYDDNVIDVCRESTYRFIEKVVDETSRLYREAGVRLSILHLGGDEVPEGAWVGAPQCTIALAQPESGTINPNAARYELTRQFFLRAREILWARDIQLAGWEEIALAHSSSATGPAAYRPDTALVDLDILPYVWNSLGERNDVAYRLANAGFDVVLGPAPFLYFDMAYDHHPAEPGQDWAGYVNTRRIYSIAPLNLLQTMDTDRLGRPLPLARHRTAYTPLAAGAEARIRGLQGQVWSETVKGEALLEYFVFPKLIALAERAWAPAPSWEALPGEESRFAQLNTAWNRFANQLGRRELPRLDVLHGGVQYRIPPPGAKYVAGKLQANVAFPGLDIRYTVDGSEPTPESNRYEGPVAIPPEATVKLRTYTTTGRGSRIVRLGR